DIAFSHRKEPHYFARDLHMSKTWRTHTLDAYLKNFEHATDEPRIGEGSVWYLQSRSAPREIAEFCPDPRVIVMLRNPTDAVISWHKQLVYSGGEPLMNFEEALAAEPARSAGERLPPGVRVRESLRYRWAFDFAQHLEPWIDAFGRERVLVLIFDDFLADVSAEYAKALNFLQVDTAFRPGFPVHNETSTRELRNLGLRRWLLRQPPVVYRLGMAVPVRWRHKAGKLAAWLTRSKSVRPDPVLPETRSALRTHFAPGVERLSAMLDRDLTHWNTPTSCAAESKLAAETGA
ncbi:MAG: sulfotransferase domain-containing protein, partial [Planctomycetota bacterium]